ncbi:MAG: GDP-mannose 4,6-dehydratase [bacterium]|nr:GDP-mannose 4,6-dehydratase [bacterium]
MFKKVLITGISGFAGSHLADYILRNKDYEISGTYLSEESLRTVKDIQEKVNLVKVDLLDPKKTQELVDDIKPDLIFHLAALTSPAESFKNPALTITNNISAQVNLLEAVKNLELKNSRILIVSSADVYGIVSQSDLPIKEDTKFNPDSPYGVSKIAQDFLGLQYFLSYKLNIIRVRSFNHIGPRQSPAFVVPSFSKKIAEIEKGKTEPVLFVGNLEPKRDLTDVRDIVAAYTLIIEKGKSGDVYNIGSGISYQISDILAMLLSFAKVKIKIEKDPSLFRPSDIPEQRADISKIKNLTGWSPSIPIETTLRETLDYWRNII